ncbi:MAG: hypothetical protein SNJ70_04280 [Armatimonadota bacterium]
MNEIENKTKYSVKIGRVLSNGIRATYENLGYVAAVSFSSFLIAMGLMFFGISLMKSVPGIPKIFLYILIFASIYIYWLCINGIFYYANRLLFGKMPSVLDTYEGIKILLAASTKLFLTDFSITLVLVGDAYFFLFILGPKMGMFPIIIGVLLGYLSILWLCMFMYHLPLLAAQLDMDSGTSVKVILKKAFLLTADNPVFTLIMFLVIITFTILCVIPTALVGVAFLYPSAVAFLLNSALKELFIKYDILQPEIDIIDDKWTLPNSWLKRDKNNKNISEDSIGDNENG